MRLDKASAEEFADILLCGVFAASPRPDLALLDSALPNSHMVNPMHLDKIHKMISIEDWFCCVKQSAR